MNNNEKIFENENIIIWHDLKGYDFEYHIENKTDKKIVYFLNELDDYVILESKDYINYFGGNYDKQVIDSFLNNDYELFSLENELNNLLTELKEIAKEKGFKNKVHIDYMIYRIFWLKYIAERIGE